MRILEIETYGRGGLLHYAFNLGKALAERGHEVTLSTTAAYELEGTALPDNLEVARVMGRWSHGTRLRGTLRNLLLKVEAIHDAGAVARFAAELRPDVIHVHCTHSALLLMLRKLAPVARRIGATLVHTAHVVTPHERIRWQDAIYRRIHAFSDLIIAHSQVDRDRLLREFDVPAERVAVIPHGDYEFFGVPTDTADGDPQDRDPSELRRAARDRLGVSRDAVTALFFGYIREYKGLDVLLEAWPAVAASTANARLLVAGDPVKLPTARRRELEDRATQLGAVHRFGYVPFADVPLWFRAADVLVMPYRHISQSGVLFLALSLGVPVVATRVGALPEMLEDGESAVLVEPESPAALSDALRRVLGDAELRERLGRSGRTVAKAHSWPAIAARTEAEFLRLREGR